MDRLWTPWRYQYISKSLPDRGCVFCVKPAAGDDRENFILHRAEWNFVLLNAFPYTSGHLMIVPYEHVSTLEGAPAETLMEMARLAQRAEKLIRAAYRPDGINLGMNLGEAAGAGVAGHIHLHVLPRWMGDANFMSTIGETRIIPEDLAVSWEKLRTGWQ